MTVANAINFIKRGQTDSDLRSRLNTAETKDELNAILAEESLVFSNLEFDEAYHHHLTECQEQDQADQLKEFKLWWTLLARFINPSSCAGGCSHCG